MVGTSPEALVRSGLILPALPTVLDPVTSSSMLKISTLIRQIRSLLAQKTLKLSSTQVPKSPLGVVRSRLLHFESGPR